MEFRAMMFRDNELLSNKVSVNPRHLQRQGIELNGLSYRMTLA